MILLKLPLKKTRGTGIYITHPNSNTWWLEKPAQTSEQRQQSFLQLCRPLFTQFSETNEKSPVFMDFKSVLQPFLCSKQERNIHEIKHQNSVHKNRIIVAVDTRSLWYPWKWSLKKKYWSVFGSLLSVLTGACNIQTPQLICITYIFQLINSI